MTPTYALSLWERALSEDIGVILTFDSHEDRRRAENILYKSRKGSGNPDLETLALARPGDAPNELWIIKKMTDMEDLK